MKNRKSLDALLRFSVVFLLVALTGNVQAAGVETSKSVLDLYQEGGPVMHFIALCSIATLALASFCGLSMRKGRAMPPSLVAQLRQLMASRDVAAAYELCRVHPCALSNALAAALLKVNFDRDQFNKSAMENAVSDACFREETRMMVVINYLNTFAVLAPMIGLLGTVSGMISSFGALTAGKAEATDLAKGIGEALIATGGGLMLAIPAMFLYFFFRGQAQMLMTDVHKELNDMLDLLTAESSPQPVHEPESVAA